MHIMHTYTPIFHPKSVCQNMTLIARLLNSPVAFHWLRSVSAVEVWHLLVIVKREYSSDSEVAVGHKARLKVVLNHTHTRCQQGQNKHIEGGGKRERGEVE